MCQSFSCFDASMLVNVDFTPWNAIFKTIKLHVPSMFFSENLIVEGSQKHFQYFVPFSIYVSSSTSGCIIWKHFLRHYINWLQVLFWIGMLKGMKVWLNGLRIQHIPIAPYHGTLFMVITKLVTFILCLYWYNTDIPNCFFTGNGIIRQDISKSSTYYVAVGNLNSERVQVIFFILSVW